MADAQPELIEIELRNYRRDGAPFWVELSIVPVADEHGWFTHWVSVQRDVSERKAMEMKAAAAPKGIVVVDRPGSTQTVFNVIMDGQSTDSDARGACLTKCLTACTPVQPLAHSA